MKSKTPAHLDRSPEIFKDITAGWAGVMADKLNRGLAKGHPHWLDPEATNVEALVIHLFAELHELLAADSGADRLLEAADVANLSFMLAQRIGDDPAQAARARAAARKIRQTYSG